MTLIITQVGVERIHSQAGLASFISTSSLSKTRCVIDCIMSVAMTLSLCCKWVAKTFSGQLRSVMKVCRASNFHRTSSDVWHPNRPGSQDSRSKPRWTDWPIELSIRSEIKVWHVYTIRSHFCSNKACYKYYTRSNYIPKLHIYYLYIWSPLAQRHPLDVCEIVQGTSFLNQWVCIFRLKSYLMHWKNRWEAEIRGNYPRNPMAEYPERCPFQQKTGTKTTHCGQSLLR